MGPWEHGQALYPLSFLRIASPGTCTVESVEGGVSLHKGGWLSQWAKAATVVSGWREEDISLSSSSLAPTSLSGLCLPHTGRIQRLAVG